ncbi:MAG: hypothetical protein Q8S08_03480 [Halomonas sp.]|nr:hypothetical protein [Halomonas sp.]MDP3534434.1 hypothetical protein [Halomonas sp.]
MHVCQLIPVQKKARTTAILGTGLLIVMACSTPLDARERDPLMGPFPYDYPDRANVQSSLLLQEARWRQARERNSAMPTSNQDSPAAGRVDPTTGDLSGGVVIINSSTSIAVGNWQQIEMTLGDGAEGLIMTENHQTNQAEAKSLSKISNFLDMESGNSGLVLLEESTAE